MKPPTPNDVITLRAPRDLRGEAATDFLGVAEASLTPPVRTLELDFSETLTVDASGVGALLELYRLASTRGHDTVVRVLDPSPDVRHFLELARLHHLFPIVGSSHPFPP